nr:MAG TPA: N-terminal of Homeobox Meis and PKNOX1 [Caudoviricetes sp.]
MCDMMWQKKLTKMRIYKLEDNFCSRYMKIID